MDHHGGEIVPGAADQGEVEQGADRFQAGALGQNLRDLAFRDGLVEAVAAQQIDVTVPDRRFTAVDLDQIVGADRPGDHVGGWVVVGFGGGDHTAFDHVLDL